MQTLFCEDCAHRTRHIVSIDATDAHGAYGTAKCVECSTEQPYVSDTEVVAH